VGGRPQTIVAVATAQGRAGVAVVRISGPQVPAISRELVATDLPPRKALLRTFLDADGQAIDTGLALSFPAPASYTGEDVLELHGHGSPVVTDLVVARAIELGARLARPGEFSERAFLNGKIDLLQAEAIADLIDSATAQAARSAMRTLTGVFSQRISEVLEQLTTLRMHVEAFIDFPDEDADVFDVASAGHRLGALEASIDDLLASAREGQLLRDGLRVAIAGRPNVGKSSLLNAMTGRETAIVTAHPGTTRDPLHAQVQLDGLAVLLVDTAGIRDTVDPVESIGVERARSAARDADVAMLVVDARCGLGRSEQEILAGIPASTPRLIVYNKIDLTDQPPALSEDPRGTSVYLSAKTGAGLPLLAQALRGLSGASGDEGVFIARRRHLEALRAVHSHVRGARLQVSGPNRAELVAEELRQAQHALATITGDVTSEDLLSQIFASFCIGK